jgi:uncharacterized protein DUF397
MDQGILTLTWYKSTRSGANNDNCVEVAGLPGGGWAVRDSKEPGAGIVTCRPGAWRVFVRGVKGGTLE